MDDSSENTQSNTGAVIPTLSKTLTQSEIQKLYPQVNDSDRYYIDVNSYQFVDRIIELWFETQGYDFWDNPYPEVTQWSITKDNEVEFVYIKE